MKTQLQVEVDMRFVTIAVLSLIAFASARAETAEVSSSTGFSKIELVQELAVGEMRKLLGWNGGNFYFAKPDGSVSVVDKTGKELLSLQAQDSNGEAVLKHPEAIAFSDVSIYVVDSEANSVAMFTPQGKYQGRFGSKTGGGLFSFSGKNSNAMKSPHGIAIYEGIVYVTDSNNGRIQLFGINGVFLTTLEIESAPENVADKETSAHYKLRAPTDIAVDARGQIYVLDTKDGLIKVYSPEGVYLKHLPEAGKPITFSIARDGIYVADGETFAINKYDFEDNLIHSFGSRGKGRGQFESLSGLTTDHERQILIGDSARGVSDVFVDEAGVPYDPMSTQPSRTSVRWEQTSPLSVRKLVCSDKGAMVGVVAADNDKKESTKIIRIVDGAVTGEILPEEISPQSVSLDKNGMVWVLDKKKGILAKLDESGKIVARIGSPGKQKGELRDPEDFAISSAGVVLVADSGNHRVQAFNSDGVFLKEIVGDASGKLDNPVAIAFDSRDQIYVVDKGRSVVSIFSANGDPQVVFGDKSAQNGKPVLAKPVALMVSQDEVFVLDSNQVKVFSLEGEYIRSFGTSGSGLGELDDPVAICATGKTTFSISERGNNRVQSFSTLYKPAAPDHLEAQGTLHAIELRWAAPASPYVKQYRIFRSLNEKSGFDQIATSNSEQYVDQTAELDKKYFYRIKGESAYGYASPKSTTVSGIAKKYVPPVLENVQVVPSLLQLKISWKPVESKYFSTYLIYQKNNEVFTKIGETTTPEFIKNSLIPNTEYTYYISTFSTDGTESEKTEVTASTLESNGPPLEIEVLKLQNVFSNSYKLYEEDGIGLIKLTNNTDKPIEKITISFMLNNFMDFPTEGKIDQISPGQTEEVKLKAVFNNKILTITEDSSIQAVIEASYFHDGNREAFNKVSTITVYDKHRMSWDEHERLATFITPKDEPIMNFARSIVTQYPSTKDESLLAAALFDAMGVMGLTYIQNPSNPYQISIAKTATTEKTDTVDYVQYPRETMDRKSGDCVDMVSFYASALESMGINTLMLEVPDHLLMMFSTGINADADGYTMDDMYVIHDGKLWIPVETTVVGKPFSKAWEMGASNYYKWKNKGLSILDIHTAWNTFKPATLPDLPAKPLNITPATIEKKFPGSFLSILKISSQTKTRPYLQAIAKNPADMAAHLQIGIILSKVGDHEEAMKYFDKVLNAEPKNAAALNNRGNLFMLEEKYSSAQKAYLAATQASANDAFIWVNLARSYKAMKDTKKAKAAFVKAQQLDPSVKLKYKAMSLELLNSL